MAEAALRFDEDEPVSGTLAGFGGLAQQFSSNNLFDITAGDITADRGPVFIRYTNKEYPLWSVEKNGRPLSIIVILDSELFFAENDWLNVCGDGDTVSDAIEDLLGQIEYFIDFYNNQAEESLTGYAITLKERFAEISLN